MSSKFETKYLQEPDLIFGNSGEDKDPRLGLKYHGPYFYSTEPVPLESIRIGIIGNKECIELANKVIEKIRNLFQVQNPTDGFFRIILE